MTPDPTLHLRPIEARDNAAMAAIIREVMTEYGAVGAGYSINDPEVDQMYEAYTQERSRFFILGSDERVLGGGGISPLAGGEAQVCELKKMYFLPEARGRGWGKRLVHQCLVAARELDYTQCYLETVERMQRANARYHQLGFRPLDQALGCTGHGSCNAWYLLDL